jgi:hypothetical protein
MNGEHIRRAEGDGIVELKRAAAKIETSSDETDHASAERPPNSAQ